MSVGGLPPASGDAVPGDALPGDVSLDDPLPGDELPSEPAPDARSAGDGITPGRLQRAAPLGALSARTAGEAAVVGLRGKLTGAPNTEFHVRTAERYAELLGRSKGALMKAGQMLSFVSAGPVVPQELRTVYRTALARLQDDAPPMADKLAREVLERELGRPVEKVFAQFDWTPLAAASIGQVHAARLHDGREVAVKIQYPGVGPAIGSDLKNGELLAAFLGLISGLSPRKVSFDVRGAARELSVRIVEELDYRREAANQAKFAAIYRGHPFIRVPPVLGELSTGRVRTQELMCGKSWSEALLCKQQLRDRWGEAIYRFVYGSYYRFGVFHADPHPGNYLFHEDGSVSFLDFGCVKRFTREQIDLMNTIARACMREDVLGTWRASVEGGFFRSCDPVTAEEVFAYWREAWELWWAQQPFTITPGVRRAVDRAPLLPGGPLGERVAPPHRAAAVHDHGPDRDRRGVALGRAARH